MFPRAITFAPVPPMFILFITAAPVPILIVFALAFVPRLIAPVVSESRVSAPVVPDVIFKSFAAADDKDSVLSVVIVVAPVPVRVAAPDAIPKRVAPDVIKLRPKASVVPIDASALYALPFCRKAKAPIIADEAGICTSLHREIVASYKSVTEPFFQILIGNPEPIRRRFSAVEFVSS